jgi:sphingomyelin phosphodiesterase
MKQEVNNIVDILARSHNITIPNNHTDSLLCKTCLYTFNKFHQLLDKKYGLRLFEELIAKICSIGLEYEVCKNAIDLYAPVVINSLIEHYLDAEYICTNKFICKFDHYVKLNPDDYARKLLNDKPANIIPTIDEASPVLKVLHVTDIHTDMKYEEVFLNN